MDLKTGGQKVRQKVEGKKEKRVCHRWRDKGGEKV